MPKKLTITVDVDVYNGLHGVIGRRRISRLYPAEAYITLNGARRKAMADQLTTVSKLRLVRRLESLSSEDLGG